MKHVIATISGDGIGPENMRQAKKVIEAVEKKSSETFEFIDVLGGGASLDRYGKAITKENFEKCKAADAILLANIGGNKWKNNPIEKRPERLLFHLRGDLGLKVNIRPIHIRPTLEKLSSLKPEYLNKGLDIVVVRDIVGGCIPSEKYTGEGKEGREAFDKEYYNERMITDTINWAVKMAMLRNKKITSLDKANALASSKLWRDTFHNIMKNHPDINAVDELIDNAAQHVITNASNYDVIATTNMYGDIISDEIVGLAGAGGTLGAATLGNDGKGMYEPNQLHNTDESIINKNVADPLGLIAAVALMMRYSFGLNKEAAMIEQAINKVISSGYSTIDIYFAGRKKIGTEEMGSLVAEEILD